MYKKSGPLRRCQVGAFPLSLPLAISVARVLQNARMKVTFRHATPADALNGANIYLTSRKTCLPFAPLAHSAAEVRQWLAEVLIPSGGVTVAALAHELVGIMALSHDGQIDWIDQLYLHPSVVSRGIGSQFLERAKQELGPVIRLYTLQANTGSRRFYERHGFQPIAFSDGHNNEERCPDVLYEFTRHA